jgi:ribosomal protein L30E
MARVVPSNVVRAIDRMLPEMANKADAFPQMSHDQLPWLAALAELVEAVPHSGRAARLGQTCDRGTALAAIAAVEFVVQDLTL